MLHRRDTYGMLAPVFNLTVLPRDILTITWNELCVCESVYDCCGEDCYLSRGRRLFGVAMVGYGLSLMTSAPPPSLPNNVNSLPSLRARDLPTWPSDCRNASKVSPRRSAALCHAMIDGQCVSVASRAEEAPMRLLTQHVNAPARSR
jgi:hypothetical protein